MLNQVKIVYAGLKSLLVGEGADNYSWDQREAKKSA